ncbi:MAG TPA: 3-oxoacyl-ACP reductase FabG [Thermodesulfovibrionia bacterium]|nr:3-oxoacyl-ACP reductase FabG [Thermodesulfovibrionia bacterium]
MNKKSVLVTGASRGIGRAIAIQLGQNGYSVVLNYHKNQTSAQESLQLIQQSGGQGRLLQFDISQRAQCQQVLQQDIAEYGVYYGVVCNAGIAQDNAFPALTGEEWDSVIHTNLDGFYNVLQPVILPMIRARKGGRIVTISSVSGMIGNRGQVNYSAAKAGIIGATKALAIELARRSITVNCVAPGLIETDMTHDLPMEKIKEMIPAQRLGKPAEVASLVSYLMSESAAYITRQVISVNGGLI